MSGWEPRDQGPRRQRPATPPQWQRDAPPVRPNPDPQVERMPPRSRGVQDEYEQPQPIRQPGCQPDPQGTWPPQQPRYQPAVSQYRPSPDPHPSAAPRPAHRWPPYPAHLVRFPAVLPRSRRRRGHSVGHYVYLGTHPIALLVTLYINAMILCVVVSWLALVWSAWAMWALLVTVGWLCQLAAAALRR